MTMAPINRFQHPVPPNFADMVFGNTRNNDSNSKDPICNFLIPEKTKESEKYIKEFLSTVRPELLKKRGVKTPVSVKDLMLQTTKFEPFRMDIDDNINNECENMDWSIRSGTVTRECSFVTVSEISVDDLSSVFRNNKKIWMKLLQFEENYRPPYYGTWTKSSKIISGRRPFAKDTSILDYEYDKYGILDAYEIIGEADESASIASSESSPFKKKRGSYKEYNQTRIIEPLRPLVIGPIFEENPCDGNNQLAEYSTKFLNADILLPYNPFAIPIANKRKAKGSSIEDTITCDKEQASNKSRSKGKSSQKNKDQTKNNEVKPTANAANDNVMVTSNCTS
ncbi:15669_t:CDS:2 [Dentiscutata erythropus]|uniref:15669_t:CDS:1 n=1 Tax=Dentiscutata erythropus TaxID=1348616 RepID=A0A9N8YVX3_9GLOM|nr:15669_t:CDS:2 [Dentiscutata erythropus]